MKIDHPPIGTIIPPKPRVRSMPYHRIDDAGQITPITWIPKPSNPSKLIEHVWDGEKWHATPFARFVPLKRTEPNG